MAWCDLPEVALIRLLNYLPVREQLNARLVCRYWKQIADSSLQQDELILFLEIYPRPVYWYHDGREADLGNAILVNQRGFLENKFSLKYFRRLCRLMVVSRMDTNYKRLLVLVEASCQQLEHLQFNYLGREFRFSAFYMPPAIHMANLRTFYSHDGMPRGLDLPLLSELYVYSHLDIQATDEKTKMCIQRLRTLLVHELSYPPGFEFSNLEVLYFNESRSKIILSDFPRLKELHYFELVYHRNPEIKDALNNLLEQKRRLKRDQLRVYFDGLELQNRTDLELLDTYLESVDFLSGKLSFLNKSVLRLIKETPWRLKFDLLIKVLMMSHDVDRELTGLPEGDELVKSMFRSAQYIQFERFTLWHSLNLFKMPDRFQYVCSASVSNEYDQALLDRLPDALPHLVEFFYDLSMAHRIPKFQFIGRFKSLHQFYLESEFRSTDSLYRFTDTQLLSTDELRFIFENCKFINRFALRKSNETSCVDLELFRLFGCKSFRAEWRFSRGAQFASATFSVEELLDYFEASKWVEKNEFICIRRETTPISLTPADIAEIQSLYLLLPVEM